MEKKRFSFVIEATDGNDDLDVIRRANDLLITKHIREQLQIGLREAHEFALALRGADFSISDDALLTLCRSLGVRYEAAKTGKDVETALELALEEIKMKSPMGLTFG